MQFGKDECLLCHLQRQQIVAFWELGYFFITIANYLMVRQPTDPALLKRALKTSLTNIKQMIQLLLLLLTYCYSITMI